MPLKSFFIIVVLAMIVAVLFIELAGVPGEVAARRAHPQAKAINLLGWIGLPLGIVPWMIALIWSNLDPLNLVTDLDAEVKSNGGSEDDTSAAT
jgi:hypothetical protein